MRDTIKFFAQCKAVKEILGNDIELSLGQTETLPKFQTNATYLGWNGLWVLEFELPIFTWIHKLENLGWIYD